jgi:hypothetical protein
MADLGKVVDLLIGYPPEYPGQHLPTMPGPYPEIEEVLLLALFAGRPVGAETFISTRLPFRPAHV